MSEVLHGTVKVALGGHTYTLKPTLDAALRIEAHFGGLRGAIEALRLLSITATAHIIVSGANLPDTAHADVAEQIFKVGVSGVCSQLSPYIAGLLNPTPPSVSARGKDEAASTAQ